jgi:hypothetical protein
VAETPFVRNVNRRKFINGRWTTRAGDNTPGSVEIASILVQARPERLDAAARAIDALPDTQIYSRDPRGKLVVVIRNGGCRCNRRHAQHDLDDAGGANGSTGVSRHGWGMSSTMAK